MRLKNCILSAAVALLSVGAHAQSAGSNVIGLGWIHVTPLDSSEPLSVQGVTVPNTGTRVDDADTLGVTLSHFFTDHIAVESISGVPPKFKFTGTGILAAPAINPLGDAKLWSPTLLLKYYFRQAEAKWRPYVGLGVSYIWFNGGHVNPAFQQGLSLQLTNGQSASLPTTAKIDSVWSPVFNAGLNYNFDRHWSAGLSVSYLPFGTQSNLTTTLPNGQSIHSVAKIKLDPLVTSVSVNYRF
jgi:outer membrane protein